MRLVIVPRGDRQVVVELAGEVLVITADADSNLSEQGCDSARQDVPEVLQLVYARDGERASGERSQTETGE